MHILLTVACVHCELIVREKEKPILGLIQALAVSSELGMNYNQLPLFSRDVDN